MNYFTTDINSSIYRLRGATILIGKDPESNALSVSVGIKGKLVNFKHGLPGSVPNCVSRCQPNQNIAHCRLTITPDCIMHLENIKPQNVTYVNGMPIAQCMMAPGSTVQLGYQMFNLDVSGVIHAAHQEVDKVLPPEYSLNHLENVWESYRSGINNIKKRQKHLNLLSRLSMPFTVGAGLIGGIMASQGMSGQIFAWIFTGIGLIIMLVGFILSARDKSTEEIELLGEALQDTYVCPNPACKHFLGMQPYKVLRQTKQCPYCRCKFDSGVATPGSNPFGHNPYSSNPYPNNF